MPSPPLEHRRGRRRPFPLSTAGENSTSLSLKFTVPSSPRAKLSNPASSSPSCGPSAPPSSLSNPPSRQNFSALLQLRPRPPPRSSSRGHGVPVSITPRWRLFQVPSVPRLLMLSLLLLECEQDRRNKFAGARAPARRHCFRRQRLQLLPRDLQREHHPPQPLWELPRPSACTLPGPGGRPIVGHGGRLPVTRLR